MKFECAIEKKYGVMHPEYIEVGISGTTLVTLTGENDQVYLEISEAKKLANEILKNIQMLEKIKEDETARSE